MTRYQDNAPAKPFMVESRQPVGPSRFETHVQVPVALAGIVALAVTFGLVIGTWRFGWPWDVTWIGGLMTFIVMLGWRLLWVDHLSWRMEKITGRELDGKPGLGKPAPFGLLNPDEARRTADGYAAAQDTRSRQAELLEFVARCATAGESEESQGIGPGQRKLYCDQRDTLMKLGIAAWKVPGNVRLGWKLRVTPAQAQAIIERHIR